MGHNQNFFTICIICWRNVSETSANGRRTCLSIKPIASKKHFTPEGLPSWKQARITGNSL